MYEKAGYNVTFIVGIAFHILAAIVVAFIRMKRAAVAQANYKKELEKTGELKDRLLTEVGQERTEEEQEKEADESYVPPDIVDQ